MSIFMKHFRHILLFNALILSLLSQAGPGHWEHKVKKMTRHLDLTTEQQVQVKEIVKSNQPKRESLRSDIKQLRQQLKALLKSDSLDESQVREVNLAIADKKTSLMILRTNEKKLIKDQLTSDQLSKLEKYQSKRKEHHADRKNRYKNH